MYMVYRITIAGLLYYRTAFSRSPEGRTHTFHLLRSSRI